MTSQLVPKQYLVLCRENISVVWTLRVVERESSFVEKEIFANQLFAVAVVRTWTVSSQLCAEQYIFGVPL